MLHRKQWIYNKISDTEVDKISAAAGVSPLTARVLLNRGINDPVQVEKFMNPSLSELYDPFLLPDMAKAVERIEAAVRGGERVVIYGDYDVDGITSTSAMLDFLEKLGVDADYYIPDRLDEGYGLSVGAMDRILESGPSLIITVDCGITAVEEVRYVAGKGIDIIITDHHECKEILPDAVAVVNPCRPDCGYPFKELAGVGVVFKLIQALCVRLDMGDAYQDYLDIVTIGTVADVVPLLGENRAIVKSGIPAVENTANLGLKTLIDVSGLKGKPVNTFGIGFILAPRINAAGRIGDAGRAVRLFTTRDASEAQEIAVELNEENKLRQDTELEILRHAEVMISSEIDMEKEKVLVVSGEAWHHGVIGIVASRITEKYYRPCILFSEENGMCKGSGRSIEGFNLFKALNHCEGLLEKYGGHELAAGLTLSCEKLRAFRSMINRYADEALQEEELVPKLKVDAYVRKEDITLENVKELEALAPFGAGNPSPVFAYDELGIDEIRAVGDGRHLKMRLKGGGIRLDAIGFNMGTLIDILTPDDVVNAAFSLEINTWRNTETVQLNLKDIRFGDETLSKNKCLYSLDRHIESGSLKEYNNDIDSLKVDEVVPDRSDMVAVYQYLRANCHESMVIDDLFIFAKKIAVSYRICMNYLKVRKSLQVFEELRLLETEPVWKYGMRVTFLNEVKGKTNLENSGLYRKLQALKKGFGQE